MTPLKIWFSGRSCFGLKYFRAKVGIGPKYAWGQSGLGAKLGVSPLQDLSYFEITLVLLSLNWQNNNEFL